MGDTGLSQRKANIGWRKRRRITTIIVAREELYRPLVTCVTGINIFVPAKHSPGKDNAPYSFPSRLPVNRRTPTPPQSRSRPPSKNVSCTLFTIGRQDECPQNFPLGLFPAIIEGASRETSPLFADSITAGPISLPLE